MKEMKEYSIDIQPYPKRLQVSYKGTILANTLRALQLHETGHQDVFYIPIEDVQMELFEPSKQQTHCPLKGDASYWSLNLPEEKLDNLIWAYEAPYQSVSDIGGYLAFYQGRVEIQISD